MGVGDADDSGVIRFDDFYPLDVVDYETPF